jgi:hypothetical protein
MRNLQIIALLAVTLSAAAETSIAWMPLAANTLAQAPAPDSQAPPGSPAPGSPPAESPPSDTPPSGPTVPPVNSRIPSIAIPALGLETSVAWKGVHDDQTKGSSNGATHYPIFPDGRNGLAGRQFVTWYGDKAGERFHLTFARDATATHFVYAANVYLVDPGQIANVEMDMNQVMSDGRTVIFGVQCAAHSKSWEYTYVNSSGSHWHPSNIHCNPHDWGSKKWHNIQIASHRDDDGNVTYDWVCFDGVYTDFQNATVPAAQSLRWTPGELLVNFQIDGAQKTGVMDAYLNNLAVYRW